jgi:hypothetical protein
MPPETGAEHGSSPPAAWRHEVDSVAETVVPKRSLTRTWTSSNMTAVLTKKHGSVSDESGEA